MAGYDERDGIGAGGAAHGPRGNRPARNPGSAGGEASVGDGFSAGNLTEEAPDHALKRGSGGIEGEFRRDGSSSGEIAIEEIRGQSQGPGPTGRRRRRIGVSEAEAGDEITFGGEEQCSEGRMIEQQIGHHVGEYTMLGAESQAAGTEKRKKAMLSVCISRKAWYIKGTYMMRGGAVVARQAHNLKADSSILSPATST